jgi:hypothetical protein
LVNPGLLQVGLVELGWPSMTIALVSLTLRGFGVGVGGSEGMAVLLPLHATRMPVSTRTNKLQLMPRVIKESFLSCGFLDGPQPKKICGVTSATIHLPSISFMAEMKYAIFLIQPLHAMPALISA